MKTGSLPSRRAPVAGVDAQRAGHARVERPRPRVVRLVLVEAHHAATEVDGVPRQTQRLPFPHPLSRQEAPEQAVSERDGRACERRSISSGTSAPSRMKPAAFHETERSMDRANAIGFEASLLGSRIRPGAVNLFDVDLLAARFAVTPDVARNEVGPRDSPDHYLAIEVERIADEPSPFA
jgi:hypothetical protein